MRKRLLVFSHAGVLNVNRAPFQWFARKSGAEVTLVVPCSWKGDLIRKLRFIPSPDDAPIRVVGVPVGFSGNGSLFFLRRNLRAILAGNLPDYVFVDEEPWSVAVWQIYREFPDVPKCVFTKQNLKKKLPFPFRQMERAVYRQSERIFAVSREVEEVLRWRGYRGTVTELHHTYDPGLFRPADGGPEKRRLRKEFGIPEDSVALGYVGRLSPEKGVEDLIAAVRAAGPLKNLFLILVGNGPLERRCEKSLSELPVPAVMRPALPHDRVGRLLASLDILVLPSRTTPRWKEQFGRILVEAMACGVAVIGSDSGEIPHLIARCEGGESFAEGNAQALSKLIQEWVGDGQKVRAFSDKGFHYVSRHLTHESVSLRLAQELGFLVRT